MDPLKHEEELIHFCIITRSLQLKYISNKIQVQKSPLLFIHDIKYFTNTETTNWGFSVM